MTQSKSFITRDSGARQSYNSGMVRDTQENKPRFDLINPEYLPYTETLLYRWAMLMERGAVKYGNRNWEKANSKEELDRFKASAWRHFIHAMGGDESEDHWSAICFNINAIISLQWRLNNELKEKIGN